jgi:4-oxalocrotonate tautomerase
MPRVTVEMLEGRTLDQKRALAKAICAATCECFNVPINASQVRFEEVRFEDFASSGELRSDATTREGYPLYGLHLEPRITAKLSEGRPIEQKRAFVKRLAEKTAEILELPQEAIMILLEEMRDDLFSKGGVLYCDGGKPGFVKR